MKARAFAVLILAAPVLLGAAPAGAHIGSPDTYFEGSAGPYKLFVAIKAPQVIPGVAEIEIRSETANVAQLETTITTLAGKGTRYAPTPDVARRSEQDPQFFTSSLWLMQPGAMRVKIIADGAQGRAELSVPLASFAQTTLKMDRGLGGLLFAMMVLLAAGLIAIVAAGARESRLEPGASASQANVRGGRIAGAVAAVLVISAIVAGRFWWNVDASAYAANAQAFKPRSLTLSLEPGGRLLLRVPDLTRPINEWSAPLTINALIPDHGHLMHLFLIRTPGMDQALHLHPQRLDNGDFTQILPPDAAGSYQAFADIVDASGFPWTLVGKFDVTKSAGAPLAGDDAEVKAPVLSSTSTDTAVASLGDGSRIVWERDSAPLKSGVPQMLRFRVEDSEGKPVRDLRPYMAMAAHAIVVRSDFGVFAHLHPCGSVPMASLMLAAMESPDSASAAGPMPGMVMAGEAIDPLISIPYGFPGPGLYRIIVQVKHAGAIRSGVFDAHVS